MSKKPEHSRKIKESNVIKDLQMENKKWDNTDHMSANKQAI